VLAAGDRVRVRLSKATHSDVVYDMDVLQDDGNHIVVRGPWAEQEARDLGFAVFAPGDVFTEHYWRDRWYAIKEVRSADGAIKGWYTDIARPVRVTGGTLVSEDLELDLWVSGDRRTIVRLDEDEFEARGLERTDPAAARRARAALDDLAALAADGWDSVLRD
jgi:predicted RNA-binding protein associated with RNAse of E/G family